MLYRSRFVTKLVSPENLKVVKALFANAAFDVNMPDPSGLTPMAWACKENKLDLVQVLLERPDLDVNKISQDRTALHFACEKGHFEIVKILLQNENIKVMAQDKTGRTPLQLAQIYGHCEIVCLMTEL